MEENDFIVKKCGLKFDPVGLVISYVDMHTNKMRRRTMPLRDFDKNSKIDNVVLELQDSKHKRFINLIPRGQLVRLLTIAKDKLTGMSLEASLARNNDLDKIDPEENLNKVDEETLQRKKLRMDALFERNRKKPDDPDFQYDIEVDFDNEAKIESCGWDSDSDGEF
ncbi:hypothetical protein LOTGIDRAFT_146419 [Lottia gigantea]|uniref:Centrosomal protein of 19 kDa n=1 Tax=Lottia gigantea TaxID=225164 RepID=V3ZHZ2_LOTGI|nr:hypothetical protein LOTGIDRAFT_146419 [Lottia gigantea]ESO83827.1 hypothetical protein LOTGIDRAFT_146419 [Lottia gigantea]